MLGLALDLWRGAKGIGGSGGFVESPASSWFGSGENGGWFRADLGATAGQWNDQSGNENHLVQSTSANQFELTTSISGRACYKPPEFSDVCWWTMPAGITIDRRAHSIWCIYRLRSSKNGSDGSTILNAGAGVTDLLYDISTGGSTRPNVFRAYGTGAKNSTIVGESGLAVTIVTATASGVTIYAHGQTASLAAHSAGSVSGGRVLARLDGYPIDGEVYEFGIIDRALTAEEITDFQAYAASYYRGIPAAGLVHVNGDSLTEGQQAVSVLSWPSIVDFEIGATYAMINESKGSNTMAAIASNAARSAGSFRSGFSKYVSVLWAGINDIKSGTAPATVLANVAIYNAAMQGAGYTTIACTLAPTSHVDMSASDETNRQTFNSLLLSSPATYNADHVVDLASLTELSDPNDTTYFESDKLHLKDPAFEAIASAVKAQVIAI